MPAGVRKIPTAMDSPATAAIAEARPSLRCGAPLTKDSCSDETVMDAKKGKTQNRKSLTSSKNPNNSTKELVGNRFFYSF
jgi:hypothetical protein